MSYTKTIVCLANSRKRGGRCIAGKVWQRGNPGEWVRPVSTRPDHEISDDEGCYKDWRNPELLDILDVSCESHQPLSHQGENHVMDLDNFWEKQGKLDWNEIQRWLDNPATLWNNGESSYSYLNNRVKEGLENGTSLYLISVDNLRLLVGQKASGKVDTRRAVSGEFHHKGYRYRMAVTDPVIEDMYLKQADGTYNIPHPVLCISLGDIFEGYFYKLIAAVLYQERFK